MDENKRLRLIAEEIVIHYSLTLPGKLTLEQSRLMNKLEDDIFVALLKESENNQL